MFPRYMLLLDVRTSCELQTGSNVTLEDGAAGDWGLGFVVLRMLVLLAMLACMLSMLFQIVS